MPHLLGPGDSATVRGGYIRHQKHALQPCRCDWVAQSTVLRCHLPPVVSSGESTALECVRSPMPCVQEHGARSASAARCAYEFGLSHARACARGFGSPPPCFSWQWNAVHRAQSEAGLGDLGYSMSTTTRGPLLFTALRTSLACSQKYPSLRVAFREAPRLRPSPEC